MMICRIDELKNKQVVCVDSGDLLGYVSDIELDTETAGSFRLLYTVNRALWDLWAVRTI